MSRSATLPASSETYIETLRTKQFVFLIGAPRSGTTWLQAMLGAHPSVCTTDELELFDFFTSRWQDSWNSLFRHLAPGCRARPGLTGVWTEEEFHDFLREFVDRVYSRVLQSKPAATVLLDKTPQYSEYVDHIHMLIPGAKFIHLIRDGRDVAVSLMEASRGWGQNWAPRTLEAAAALWKKSVDGSRQAAKFQGQYREVLYDDLQNRGASTLQSLFDFIGVPVDAPSVNTIVSDHRFEKMQQKSEGPGQVPLPSGFFRKGTSGDWRAAFTPSDRYLFHTLVGDQLCQMGFAGELWWAERPYQRLTLPLMALLNGRGFSRGAKLLRAIRYIGGPRLWERLRVLKAARSESGTRGGTDGSVNRQP